LHGEFHLVNGTAINIATKIFDVLKYINIGECLAGVEKQNIAFAKSIH
jgi:hypothetical protein